MKQLIPAMFFQKKANGPKVFQRCGSAILYEHLSGTESPV
jgi:hypothetical protein